jgi:hypothetical protein
MKANTISFSGFSREDETAAVSMFNSLNERLGGAWSLKNETDAELVVIDMDTVYGYMTWLKAQSAGKKTAAVTSSERSDADFVLSRPLKTDSLLKLLSELTIANLAPTDHKPDETVIAEKPVVVTAPTAPAAVSAADAIARVTGQHVAMPPLQLNSRRLFSYLKPGKLKNACKLQLDGAPSLVIDPALQQYYGSPMLKPLLPYAAADFNEEDFQFLTDAELAKHKAGAGAAQALSRLIWLANLAGHGNELIAGAQRNGEFHLSKWPTSEREFPKHFRIATIMVKAPIKLGDVAAQSGASLNDVIDFVNANIATGHIKL